MDREKRGKTGKYGVAAVLSGVLISVMIYANGRLTQAIGNYHATVLIHLSGLVAVVFVPLLTRQRLHPGARLPLWMYLGGVVGVLTVVFNNASAPVLGISITLALGLLGQLVFSLIIDRFGLFGMPVKRFRLDRVLSALLVLTGIAIMMIG